jgi:CRP-like cAMP-binding protein
MKFKLIAYKSPKDTLPPLIKKFNFLYPLNNEEIASLMKLHQYCFHFDSKKTFLEAGVMHEKSYIVMRGWAFRYELLSNGNQQIINYYLPGDIISPFAAVMPKTNYSVASVNKMELCVFENDELIELFIRHPRIGLYYGWMLGREDSSLAEQIVRLGCRSAYQRTAHLLLELFHRLKIVGLAYDKENAFPLPVTQQLLADTLGMSVVHMNRTLKKLQQANLITVSFEKIYLDDIDSLKQVAEFENTFLEQAKSHLLNGFNGFRNIASSA